jgi:hypothetical protein
MQHYPEMHTMAWRMMLTGAWPTLATDQLDPAKFQAMSRLAFAVETSNVLLYREMIRGR